jgi:sugar O-acyltransferase (sialic acid O-acetyltransferase NeuD family)
MVRLIGKYKIAGFLDDVDIIRKGTKFCGATILGGSEQLEHLRQKKIKYIILGFGNCQARLALSAVTNKFGFELAISVHPGAIVADDVTIGAGTVVMAGAVINPGSAIHENVIINTSSSIDHDCVIMNGVHVGPGAHLGGAVTVDQGTWIGIGAIVKDKVKIGKNVIVGAGAVVLKDIPDGVTAFGVPAKIIK